MHGSSSLLSTKQHMTARLAAFCSKEPDKETLPRGTDVSADSECNSTIVRNSLEIGKCFSSPFPMQKRQVHHDTRWEMIADFFKTAAPPLGEDKPSPLLWTHSSGRVILAEEGATVHH